MKKEILNRIVKYKRFSKNVEEMPSVISKVVATYKDVLLSANRDQMLLGRDADGNELGPSYLQDPYFDTPAEAQAYARMKYALESLHRMRLWNPFQLFPDKDRNTPNLIVTGPFQDSMFINTSSTSYTIGSTYIASSDINTKYKGRIFGLAPESKQYFWTEFLRKELIKSLKNGV